MSIWGQRNRLTQTVRRSAELVVEEMGVHEHQRQHPG